MRDAELIQEPMNDGSFYCDKQKEYLEHLQLHQALKSTIYPSNKIISPETFELINEIYRKEKNRYMKEKDNFEFFLKQYKDLKKKQKMKLLILKKYNMLKNEVFFNIFLFNIKFISNILIKIKEDYNIKFNNKNIIQVNVDDSPIFDETLKKKEEMDEHCAFYEKMDDFYNEHYSSNYEK